MSALLACRPVDDDVLRRYVPDLPLPPIYADSEKGACENCGMEIWVGPQVGLAKQVDPESPLVCFICAVAISRGDASVTHLGNERYLTDPPTNI